VRWTTCAHIDHRVRQRTQRTERPPALSPVSRSKAGAYCATVSSCLTRAARYCPTDGLSIPINGRTTSARIFLLQQALVPAQPVARCAQRTLERRHRRRCPRQRPHGIPDRPLLERTDQTPQVLAKSGTAPNPTCSPSAPCREAKTTKSTTERCATESWPTSRPTWPWPSPAAPTRGPGRWSRSRCQAATRWVVNRTARVSASRVGVVGSVRRG
jgi:hypothetical protein